MITVLVMATGAYNQWVDQLLVSIGEHFLAGHDVSVLLATDAPRPRNVNDRVTVTSFPVQSLRYPEATLFRHHVFLSQEQQIVGDHVFYVDVDCRFVAPIAGEVLNPFTVVQHAGYGFYTGSWENRPESAAFMHPVEHYVVGGFNGGEREHYLEWMRFCRSGVDADLQRGLIARWHDESHINKFIEGKQDVTVLPPTYCYPEEHAVNATGIHMVCLTKSYDLTYGKNHQPDASMLDFDRSRL